MWRTGRSIISYRYPRQILDSSRHSGRSTTSPGATHTHQRPDDAWSTSLSVIRLGLCTLPPVQLLQLTDSSDLSSALNAGGSHVICSLLMEVLASFHMTRTIVTLNLECSDRAIRVWDGRRSVYLQEQASTWVSPHNEVDTGRSKYCQVLQYPPWNV